MTRTFTTHERAASTWYRLSTFPSERAIAARKCREIAPAVDGGPEILVRAIGELAADGYHAIALTRVIVGDRVRAIREREGDAERAAAVAALISGALHRLPTSPRRSHRPPIASSMPAIGAVVVSSVGQR